MMIGVGVSGPLGCRGLVQGMMPVEGIRCPEGSINWYVVVYQPPHQGEVDRWCWGGRGRWRGGRGKGRGYRVGGAGLSC